MTDDLTDDEREAQEKQDLDPDPDDRPEADGDQADETPKNVEVPA